MRFMNLNFKLREYEMSYKLLIVWNELQVVNTEQDGDSNSSHNSVQIMLSTVF